MDKTTANLFTVDLRNFAESKDKRITLIPKPDKNGIVASRDGRRFRHDEKSAAKLIKLSTKNIGSFALNLNHEDTAAYGWVDTDTLQVEKNLSVTGKLRLTARGQEALEAEDFRYLSPELDVTDVFALYESDDSKLPSATMLTGVALTNRPALNLAGLFTQQETRENDMNEETLIALASFGITKQSSADEVKAAIAKRSDYSLLEAKVADLEKQVEEFSYNALDAEVETVLSEAEREQKITPSTRAHYKKMGEMDLEMLRETVKHLPSFSKEIKTEKKPEPSDPGKSSAYAEKRKEQAEKIKAKLEAKAKSRKG